LLAAIAACALALAAPATAQQANRDRAAGSGTLTFPGADAAIQITAHAPDEARVGQSFDYRIEVRNVSDNIVVHDLVIAQHSPEKFEIQSSRLEGGEQQGQKKQQGQSQQGQSKQRKQRDSQQNQQNQNQGNQQRKKQQDSQDQQQSRGERQPQKQQQSKDQQQQSVSSQSGQQAQQGQDGKSRWTIKQLKPGESRTIHLTAISDTEGQGQVCLAIESFTPALCLTTRFTKPELEIVKEAPNQVDICEDIEVVYYVKNDGTGDLKKFTIEDDLPDGLQTADGKKRLEFTLEDGLQAGDVRKFVAELRATRTGEFASRASVRGPEGTSAQSNNVTIRVQKADLAVAIEGPKALEVDSLANYTVRVTNTGDAPAPNSQLTLYFPRSADMVRASQPQPSSRAVQSQGSQQKQRSQQGQSPESQPKKQQSQDQPASKEKQSGSQNQNQNASTQQQDQRQMSRQSWDLGTLRPGQTVQISYALRAYEGGQLQQTAVAEYVCATAQDREIDQAMLRTQDRLLTEIIALPGLRLTVIDDKDPVPTGGNVTYTIRAANEGNAEASNVQISAILPETVEFVRASGDTNGKNSEGQVSFEPAPTLQPGESATWTVVVKVNQQGDAAMKVEMTSADFDKPVTAEEPTTLFDAGQTQSRNRNQDRKQDSSQQEEQPKQNEDQ
jgi:uncharacterized repeat protein (TIGR01451 family)